MIPDALESTSPQTIWVTTDINMGSSITVSADHTLIIDSGKLILKEGTNLEGVFKKEGQIDWDKAYGLVIAGVRVDDNNAGNITGNMIDGIVSYDRNTKTLTLKDAEIIVNDNDDYVYGIYSSDDITIKLEGNSIIGNFVTVDYNTYYGIYAPGKDISIIGNGNLTIYDELMGILGKNITLNSTGNLTIKEYGGSFACCIKAVGGGGSDGSAKVEYTTSDGEASLSMNNTKVNEIIDKAKGGEAVLDLDIKEDSWFYEAVKYVYENGLMIGTSDNAFKPNEVTTRGMIVTILHRLEGSPSAKATRAHVAKILNRLVEDIVK